MPPTHALGLLELEVQEGEKVGGRDGFCDI